MEARLIDFTAQEWIILLTIFHFMTARNASGMEVADSLLNLLRRLKAEGYDTGDLPENPVRLAKPVRSARPAADRPSGDAGGCHRDRMEVRA